MRDEEDIHSALALGDYEAIWGHAQPLLKEHSYLLPIASSEFRTYVSLFVEGLSRVNTSKRERLWGKLVKEPLHGRAVAYLSLFSVSGKKREVFFISVIKHWKIFKVLG